MAVLVRFAGHACRRTGQLIPVRLREGGPLAGQRAQLGNTQPCSPSRNQSLRRACHRSRRAHHAPGPCGARRRTPDRVWANLEDGTPLVTARREGKGTIVLFHVTANADWSNLPLTGLFVEMLRRIVDLAPAAGGGPAAAADDVNAAAVSPPIAASRLRRPWRPLPDIRPIPAAQIDSVKASPATPAGLYRRGGQERAINITRTGDRLNPITGLPPADCAALAGPQPRCRWPPGSLLRPSYSS